MEITLNLAEARTLYEHHYSEVIPSNLPYYQAAKMVLEAVGPEEFLKMLKRIRNCKIELS